MSDPRTLVGLGVSPGIAIGKPIVVENRPLPVTLVQLARETGRRGGRAPAPGGRARRRHLADLARDAARAVGAEYGAIFEAHRLMLEDPSLLDEVERLVRTEAVNAEWALEQVTHRLVAQFEQLGDLYLRERREDLLDVALELQRSLQGRAAPSIEFSGGVGILIADDIPPSQALRLATRAVGGFASETGGLTSHTTIIAKSLGIPAVVGVAGLIRKVERAALVIVDGFEGHVLVDPDPALIQVYSLRAEEHRRRQQELLGLAHLAGQDLRRAGGSPARQHRPRPRDRGGQGRRRRGDRTLPQRVPVPAGEPRPPRRGPADRRLRRAARGLSRRAGHRPHVRPRRPEAGPRGARQPGDQPRPRPAGRPTLPAEARVLPDAAAGAAAGRGAVPGRPADHGPADRARGGGQDRPRAPGPVSRGTPRRGASRPEARAPRGDDRGAGRRHDRGAPRPRGRLLRHRDQRPHPVHAGRRPRQRAGREPVPAVPSGGAAAGRKGDLGRRPLRHPGVALRRDGGGSRSRCRSSSVSA